MDIHYNQNQSRAESYAAGIAYNPEPGKVLSARYKYGRNERIYLQANGDYFTTNSAKSTLPPNGL